MKTAVFLGCTVPTRGRNYEISVRRVAPKVGIELVDINDFSCCGFPVKGINADFTLLLALRNLGRAEKEQLPITVLCSACCATLAEAAHEARHDPHLLSEANLRLRELGLPYRGTIAVRHFGRVLFEDIGPDRIRSLVTRDLSALAVAPHYGCHYLKPSGVHGAFDDPEMPRTLNHLLSAIGVKVIDLKNRKHCCGGGVLSASADVAMKMADQKLGHLKAEGADALCLICPFCAVMYDDNQKQVETRLERTYGLPVLYYSQLLGLALGLDPKDLGLNMNKVKVAGLLQKIGLK